MVAIELDSHFTCRKMPYTANPIQEHRNVPEPHHEPLLIHHHLPMDATGTVFWAFLCTPNEESGCAEFRGHFRDNLYNSKAFIGA
ncbi:hypothetical protein TNCV_4704651 [Trichonephila clavipes]|nr:hypothetical protein TNCV_4704651 [Trichonephila clavipes]